MILIPTRLLLLLLPVGCTPPASNPPPADPFVATDTATPALPDPEVRWVSPELSAPAGVRQHHATVAVHPDGVALVAYSDLTAVHAFRSTPDGEVIRADLPGEDASHPQVAATEDGWLSLETRIADNALLGRVFTRDGGGGEPIPLGLEGIWLPDLHVVGEAGVLVTSRMDEILCLGFVGAFGRPEPVPCPALTGPGQEVGTPTVRRTTAADIVVWTERAPDGTFSVHRAFGAEDATTLVAGLTEPGRPMLAADPATGAHAVVWRSWVDDTEDAVFQTFTADGAPAGPRWSLGPGADRPTVGGPVGGLLTLAWEVERELFVQLRDAHTGEPRGAPIPVTHDATRIPGRPSLSMVEGADGVVRGAVTWEARRIGAFDDQVVRMRWWEIDR